MWWATGPPAVHRLLRAVQRQTRRHYSRTATPGLFGIPGLLEPKDFQRIVADARCRSDSLLQQLLLSPADATVVQLVDDMSDVLCQAYDAAECCRNVHTSPAWRQAATATCTDLGAYISELNQHTGMYHQLASAMYAYRTAAAAAASRPTSSHHPQGPTTTAPSTVPLNAAQLAAFDAETVLVGGKLQSDMEKAGIHLEEPRRLRMQELMNMSGNFASLFNQGLTGSKQGGMVQLPRGGAWGRGGAAIPAGDVGHILSTLDDEKRRRELFIAAGSSPQSNLGLLDRIIATRHELASACGYTSYAAHKAADNSLAGTPAAATAFLEQLARAGRPAADQELQGLRKLKATMSGGGVFSSAGTAADVHAWDVQYLMRRARAALCPTPQSTISEYLQLDSVLAGVTELLERSMGLSLRLTQAPRGEAWAPHVLKGEVSHPELGHVGVIYLDLHSRPGKYPGAVTFPIRCGRSLYGGALSSPCSITPGTTAPGQAEPSGRPASAAPSKWWDNGGTGYQTPVMALLADFGAPGADAHLNFSELRVLLHELGHCVHNLTSRTRYQHLWGTRCAQDVVEVPSHLWELFATDARTLQVLARHRGGGREPMSAELCGQLTAGRRAFGALELQSQVLLSLVDQAYHGDTPPVPGGGTSAVWQDLAEHFASVPHVGGTCPEARVGHLTTYGGGYYSYVYARCLASAVWQAHMHEDPLDPAAGELVCSRLLQPGGSVEPHALMVGVLGQDALQQVAGGWAPRVDDAIAQRLVSSY